MSTNAQTRANQQNSKQSTGPITPEGKAASSQNHKIHGLAAADPVLRSDDRDQFNALLERFQSDFAPVGIHEESLVAEMAAARWKLDRAQRIENAMFAALESPDGPVTTEAVMAQAFMDKNAPSGFAKLERYRAALERTYHRCVRELRVARKERNEANSSELAEKKFEKLLKRMYEAPPPGYTVEPRLVPIEKEEETTPRDEATKTASAGS